MSTKPLRTGQRRVASWRRTLVCMCQWLRDLALLSDVVGMDRRRAAAACEDGMLCPSPGCIELLPRPPPKGGAGAEANPDGASDWLPRISTADRVEDITVALELKFLLPMLSVDDDDDDTAWDGDASDGHGKSPSSPWTVGLRRHPTSLEGALALQAHRAIAETIHYAAGQRAVTLHDILQGGLQERDFWATHWIVKKANSAMPVHRHTDDGGGGSIEEGDGGTRRCHWVPVEICSPKLPWKDEVRTRAALGAVLHALRSRHPDIAVNYTCDVHVHVGRADGRPFALDTLKRLATLLWLAEEPLRSVRDPASPNYRNVYTWGAEVRLYSRLAQALDGGLLGSSAAAIDRDGNLAGGRSADDYDVGEKEGVVVDGAREYRAVGAIWMATSRLQLGRMLSGPTKQYRRLGFNFSSFGEEDERARRGPKTVEFRVLEGTLADDVVLGWTCICCALVETAVGTAGSRDRLWDLVARLTAAAEEGGLGQQRGRRHDRRAGVVGTEAARLREFLVDLGVAQHIVDAFLAGIYKARVERHLWSDLA
ncbi:hypothetical protein VTK73DRAFT_491 [Phialemonium thermophilum]|uniref:Amidoligase enzyme n=1 Tax=Phialemonium thermophilum TaxID=223376 RepID=A0ABR3VV03_9PEZI